MTHSTGPAGPPSAHARGHGGGDRRVLMTFVWLWVGVPFAYGLYELVLKMRQLFTG